MHSDNCLSPQASPSMPMGVRASDDRVPVAQKPGVVPRMRSLALLLAASSAFFGGEAQAYLIADFGFTRVSNGPLVASVHSVLNFDTVFAPQQYEYVYIVTNISNPAAPPIHEFGVYGGDPFGIVAPPLCTVLPGAGACQVGENLPNWVSNLARPAAAWGITVESDRNAIPADYGVFWQTPDSFPPFVGDSWTVNETFTFAVASPNPPIIGGAWIDPIATRSGFYFRNADGVEAYATYVPEPSATLLALAGLLGIRTIRSKGWRDA